MVMPFGAMPNQVCVGSHFSPSLSILWQDMTSKPCLRKDHTWCSARKGLASSSAFLSRALGIVGLLAGGFSSCDSAGLGCAGTRAGSESSQGMSKSNVGEADVLHLVAEPAACPSSILAAEGSCSEECNTWSQLQLGVVSDAYVRLMPKVVYHLLSRLKKKTA